MRRFHRPSLLVVSTLVAAATGCSRKADTAMPLTIETATFAPALGVDLAASTRMPSGMYYRDLTIGTGEPVANGRELSMRYSGWLPNGKPFDSNANGSPYVLQLGAKEVIDGWDLGLVGMKVGGKRQLIIPPSLGYGAAGSPPVIPPNAILVFNVELVAAR
jgi:FKBP-type peptidyl-prolyl cis-trans isomerase FkpA